MSPLSFIVKVGSGKREVRMVLDKSMKLSVIPLGNVTHPERDACRITIQPASSFLSLCHSHTHTHTHTHTDTPQNERYNGTEKGEPNFLLVQNIIITHSLRSLFEQGNVAGF